MSIRVLYIYIYIYIHTRCSLSHFEANTAAALKSITSSTIKHDFLPFCPQLKSFLFLSIRCCLVFTTTALYPTNLTCAVVTTMIRLRFDCNSTALRFYDHMTIYVTTGLLQYGLNKQAVRVATQYASAPCKLTISSHLFARWHLFRDVGYLRHQQQVDL